MKTTIALVLVASLASAVHADPPGLQKIEPPPAARAEAITATVVTGIFLGAAVVSGVRSSQKASEANDLAAMRAPASQWSAANDSAAHWHDASYVFVGATVVSVVVTGYLWNRAEPRYQVAPMPGGAMVGFTSSW